MPQEQFVDVLVPSGVAQTVDIPVPQIIEDIENIEEVVQSITWERAQNRTVEVPAPLIVEKIW